MVHYVRQAEAHQLLLHVHRRLLETSVVKIVVLLRNWCWCLAIHSLDDDK
jgi:hypothetical protein